MMLLCIVCLLFLIKIVRPSAASTVHTYQRCSKFVSSYEPNDAIHWIAQKQPIPNSLSSQHTRWHRWAEKERNFRHPICYKLYNPLFKSLCWCLMVTKSLRCPLSTIYPNPKSISTNYLEADAQTPSESDWKYLSRIRLPMSMSLNRVVVRLAIIIISRIAIAHRPHLELGQR